MGPSEAVDATVRKHLAKLDQIYDRIVNCRATIELSSARGRQGNLYSVHVDVKIPGEQIIATRGHENEDVYVAIRDAFNAVQRRVEDHVRRRRGYGPSQHRVAE